MLYEVITRKAKNRLIAILTEESDFGIKSEVAFALARPDHGHAGAGQEPDVADGVEQRRRIGSYNFV